MNISTRDRNFEQSKILPDSRTGKVHAILPPKKAAPTSPAAAAELRKTNVKNDTSPAVQTAKQESLPTQPTKTPAVSSSKLAGFFSRRPSLSNPAPPTLPSRLPPAPSRLPPLPRTSSPSLSQQTVEATPSKPESAPSPELTRRGSASSSLTKPMLSRQSSDAYAKQFQVEVNQKKNELLDQRMQALSDNPEATVMTDRDIANELRNMIKQKLSADVYESRKSKHTLDSKAANILNLILENDAKNPTSSHDLRGMIVHNAQFMQGMTFDDFSKIVNKYYPEIHHIKDLGNYLNKDGLEMSDDVKRLIIICKTQDPATRRAFLDKEDDLKNNKNYTLRFNGASEKFLELLVKHLETKGGKEGFVKLLDKDNKEAYSHEQGEMEAITKAALNQMIFPSADDEIQVFKRQQALMNRKDKLAQEIGIGKDAIDLKKVNRKIWLLNNEISSLRSKIELLQQNHDNQTELAESEQKLNKLTEELKNEIKKRETEDIIALLAQPKYNLIVLRAARKDTLDALLFKMNTELASHQKQFTIGTDTNKTSGLKGYKFQHGTTYTALAKDVDTSYELNVFNEKAKQAAMQKGEKTTDVGEKDTLTVGKDDTFNVMVEKQFLQGIGRLNREQFVDMINKKIELYEILKQIEAGGPISDPIPAQQDYAQRLHEMGVSSNDVLHMNQKMVKAGEKTHPDVCFNFSVTTEKINIFQKSTPAIKQQRIMGFFDFHLGQRQELELQLEDKRVSPQVIKNELAKKDAQFLEELIVVMNLTPFHKLEFKRACTPNITHTAILEAAARASAPKPEKPGKPEKNAAQIKLTSGKLEQLKSQGEDLKRQKEEIEKRRIAARDFKRF